MRWDESESARPSSAPAEDVMVVAGSVRLRVLFRVVTRDAELRPGVSGRGPEARSANAAEAAPGPEMGRAIDA